MAVGTRRPVVAGNWKMHKTLAEAELLARDVAAACAQAARAVDVVLCPPFTALAAVVRTVAGSGVAVGAQDLHWAERGAYTGEVSPVMVRDAGCAYVIVGHSERRTYFGETDQTVNRKVRAAVAHGLTPIVCVGERWEEREAGETRDIIARQVSGGLADIDPGRIGGLVVAYEPVWAIGTGRAARGPDAQDVAAFIRERIAADFPAADALSVRILYGGSVAPDNIGEFLDQPDVDGALVGGASLEAATFAPIVAAAAARAAR